MKKIIFTKKAPAPIGPYNQAVLVGNTLYTSGQIAINPATNELNINLKSVIEINSIQIYNTIGQLVSVQTGNALKVDVSHLKTGNYFIKINTNEGFSTSQFIKE